MERAVGGAVGRAAPTAPAPAVPAPGPTARGLIERVMRDGRPVGPECPLVFGGVPGAPRGRLVSLADASGVRSACAILVRDVRTPTRRARVGLIGWVATAPEFRGRGLAGRVLAAAEQALAEEGCELALLWADDPGFYRRRGYREVGVEVDVSLDAAALDRLPRDGETRPLDPTADAAATLRLYRAHAARAERSLAEHAALLATPGLRGRVALADGRVVAYACEGRGEDLQGVVHEWAGETAAVLGLQRRLASDARDRGLEAFAIGPDPAHPVCAAWQALGLAPRPGVLGMGRALGPGTSASDLCPTAPTPGRPLSGLFLWGLDSI